MESEDLVRQKFLEFCAKISAPKDLAIFRTTPLGQGTPHYEYEGPFHCFVVSERGIVSVKKRTLELDEILFWFISAITFEMASRYESENRDKSEDFRKKLFQKDVELLSLVNPDWGKKVEEKYTKLLGRKLFEE